MNESGFSYCGQLLCTMSLNEFGRSKISHVSNLFEFARERVSMKEGIERNSILSYMCFLSKFYYYPNGITNLLEDDCQDISLLKRVFCVNDLEDLNQFKTLSSIPRGVFIISKAEIIVPFIETIHRLNLSESFQIPVHQICSLSMEFYCQTSVIDSYFQNLWQHLKKETISPFEIDCTMTDSDIIEPIMRSLTGFEGLTMALKNKKSLLIQLFQDLILLDCPGKAEVWIDYPQAQKVN